MTALPQLLLPLMRRVPWTQAGAGAPCERGLRQPNRGLRRTTGVYANPKQGITPTSRGLRQPARRDCNYVWLLWLWVVLDTFLISVVSPGILSHHIYILVYGCDRHAWDVDFSILTLIVYKPGMYIPMIQLMSVHDKVELLCVVDLNVSG